MKTFIFKLFLLGLTIICLNAQAQTTKYVTMNGAGWKDGSSWENAYDSTGIQTAIDAVTTASGYNWVWVAKGTYYAPSTNGIIMKPGVKLFGGFSGVETDTIQRENYGLGEENQTVFSGDVDRDGINNASNYNVLSFLNSSGSNFSTNNSEINGFVITMSKQSGIFITAIYSTISPKICNNIIKNNNGSGIYIYANGGTANPLIISNLIINNSTSRGGGIYCQTSSATGSSCIATIEENLFDNNSASVNGGAIYSLQNANNICTPIINNNVIRNNFSTDNGGGIAIFFNNPGSSTYNIQINNNSIYSNASEYGGGLYFLNAQNLNLHLENNIIEFNQASYGGGIYCKPIPISNTSNVIIDFTLLENVISSNIAINGGGIYLDGNSLVSSQIKMETNSNIFKNNIANNFGGAIYISNACYTPQGGISNNLIASNYAIDGAGIYTETSTSIFNNIIYNNNALNDGTGIYILSKNRNNTSAIQNNVVYNNYAESQGGGIYCKSSTAGYNCIPVITSCTFANNQAGANGDNICTYAEVASSQCTPVITNSIIWGGASPYFIDVSGSGSCPPNTTYCAIQGGFSGTGNINLSTDNVAGPMFIQPTSFIGNALTSADSIELESANWNVSVCSPVVNHGSNAAVPSTLTTDFVGLTRIYGGTVDIGAYEQHTGFNVPVTITGLTSACAGESVTLDAGEGFSSYHWNDESTNQTVEITGTGLYSVTVSDINGCTGSDTHNVTFNNLPVSTISGNTEACEGNIITLSVASSSEYNWSNGSTSQTSAVTESGRYYVTVTNSYNCSSVDSIDITVYPLPIVEISGEATECIGNSVTLEATSGFENYVWSGGEDLESISVTESGTFTVTVTDINNCQNSAEFLVTIYDPAPEFTNNADACVGDNIELGLTNAYVSYQWNDMSSESILDVNTPGTYSVTVEDDHSCTASTSIDMLFHELPVPEISGEENTCYGHPISLDAGDYTSYDWSNEATSQTISASVSGNYSVTVTDEFGCTGTDSFNLTVFTLPIPVITGNTEACSGETIDLLVNEFADYEWSNSSNSQTITVSTSGTYSVTVTDLNNCQGIDSYIVTFHTLPTPQITGENEACDGETITLDAGVYTSYQWNDAATTRLNEVELDGNYSVIVTDLHGCTGTDDIDIVFHSIPATPTITRNEFILTSSSATGNQWYLDGIGIIGANSQNYTCTTDGDYLVIVTSEFGCVSSASQMVNVFGTNINSFEANGISLYPNPAKDQIWIEANESYIGSVIQVQNNLGQKIIEKTVISGSTQIMLLDIPTGHYLIKIITEDATLNSKFIKF